jgi:hypothetical protein
MDAPAYEEVSWRVEGVPFSEAIKLRPRSSEPDLVELTMNFDFVPKNEEDKHLLQNRLKARCNQLLKIAFSVTIGNRYFQLDVYPDKGHSQLVFDLPLASFREIFEAPGGAGSEELASQLVSALYPELRAAIKGPLTTPNTTAPVPIIIETEQQRKLKQRQEEEEEDFEEPPPRKAGAMAAITKRYSPAGQTSVGGLYQGGNQRNVRKDIRPAMDSSAQRADGDILTSVQRACYLFTLLSIMALVASFMFHWNAQFQWIITGILLFCLFLIGLRWAFNHGWF